MMDDESSCDGFVHDMVAVSDDLTFHTVTVGTGSPVFLLHGFPQTWFEWRHVMAGLRDRHTVIAVDMKGAGLSTKAVGGYDKVSMAHDLELLRMRLGHPEVQVVGHDIGAMVGYAWAATSRSAVTRLVVIDAPIPGTEAWKTVLSDPRLWHFAFHMKRDLPEALIYGRERLYVETFLRDRAYNQGGITEGDIVVYADAFALPGAVRSTLEWYRAFPQDDLDNRRLSAEPLTVPVLGVGGDKRWGPRMVEMMSELAADVSGVIVDDCNHWVPEERPAELLGALRDFLR